MLFGYLHGHVLNELQEIVEHPEETDHVLRLGLYRLPITEFPRLRELAPALAFYDGAAELDRGLDLIFTGLTAIPRTTTSLREPGLDDQMRILGTRYRAHSQNTRLQGRVGGGTDVANTSVAWLSLAVRGPACWRNVMRRFDVRVRGCSRVRWRRRCIRRP